MSEIILASLSFRLCLNGKLVSQATDSGKLLKLTAWMVVLYYLLPPEAVVSHCNLIVGAFKGFQYNFVSVSWCRKAVSSGSDLPELLRGQRQSLARKGRGLRAHL